MKTVLVIATILAVVLAEGFQETEGVIQLTETNFEDGLKLSPFVFVKFYAPWCGHCKQLAPKYTELAKRFKANNNPTVFAEVDASEQKQLRDKYKIEGYPTLLLFINQAPVKYNGGLEAEEIAAWINKRTGEQSTLLKSTAELEKLQKEHDVVVVYFGASDQDAEQKMHLEAAMTLEDLQFAHTFDPEMAKAQAVAQKSFVLFRNFDEPKLVYSGEKTTEKVTEFISANSQSAVIEFNDKAVDKIFQKQTSAIFLFKNFNAESEAAAAEFKQAAQTMKTPKLLFCMIDPNNKAGHFNRLADYLGVNVADLPKILILKPGNSMVKYSFTKPITKDNLIQYVNQFLEDPDTLERFLKSAPIPEKNDQPVKVIVGKSFDNEVINNNKDVLVKFYAPWCGHCKSLAPHYEEAAKKLAVNPNIVLAEMDSTQNETPRVSIQGFPTLKFWPGNAKDKEPITYDGPRTAEGIIDWLKQKTTQTWVEVAQTKSEEL